MFYTYQHSVNKTIDGSRFYLRRDENQFIINIPTREVRKYNLPPYSFTAKRKRITSSILPHKF